MKKLLLGLLGLFFLLGLVGFIGPALFPGPALRISVQIERGLAGVEPHEITVGPYTMPYLEGGPKDGPTLLLVHGFGGDKDNWTRFSKTLTPRFHVVAPDLPGFGQSTSTATASYDISSQVDRLHDFAQALKLGPVHIAGNSMGGHIAAVYAVRYADEVRSLTLYDNAGLDSPKKSELWKRIAKGENPLIVSTAEDFDKLFDFIFAEPPFVPPPVKSYLARMAVAHHDGFNTAWKDIFAKPMPLEPLLGGLRAPTLVVWGDEDRLIDVSTTEVLKRLVPSAKVVILPHCGHVPMVERPEESARLMAELVLGG